jgi:hypothetical protein
MQDRTSARSTKTSCDARVTETLVPAAAGQPGRTPPVAGCCRLPQNIAIPTEERFPASNVELSGQRLARMCAWAQAEQFHLYA